MLYATASFILNKYEWISWLPNELHNMYQEKKRIFRRIVLSEWESLTSYLINLQADAARISSTLL
jgi:hypothetical protein